ncbi:hypothetical protein F2P81_005608 [Scophthalmus maximus]|uniref:Uncharacterized protein n=1 Tax=Scophthalmus maximus TaxID=52904 RepID=A0A6A4T3K3_SCOMX|nr:hypothetical protein F2P81_005608 [Scophthalmus maximus]
MAAFAAAVDAVNVLSCCFPVFLCWNTKAVQRTDVDPGLHVVSTAVHSGWCPLRCCHTPLRHPDWISSESHAMAAVGNMWCHSGSSRIFV